MESQPGRLLLELSTWRFQEAVPGHLLVTALGLHRFVLATAVSSSYLHPTPCIVNFYFNC
jgi:hypothetical protein